MGATSSNYPEPTRIDPSVSHTLGTEFEVKNACIGPGATGTNAAKTLLPSTGEYEFSSRGGSCYYNMSSQPRRMTSAGCDGDGHCAGVGDVPRYRRVKYAAPALACCLRGDYSDWGLTSSQYGSTITTGTTNTSTTLKDNTLGSLDESRGVVKGVCGGSSLTQLAQTCTCDPQYWAGPLSPSCSNVYGTMCVGERVVSNKACQAWADADPVAAMGNMKTYCSSNPSNSRCEVWGEAHEDEWREIIGNHCIASELGGDEGFCRDQCFKHRGACNDASVQYCAGGGGTEARKRYCSCINSPVEGVAGAVPECVDRDCYMYGYKTTSTGPTCQMVDCSVKNELSQIGGSVTFTDFVVNQNCGNTTVSPSATPSATTSITPSVTPSTTPSVTTTASSASSSSISPSVLERLETGDEDTWFVLILLLLIAVTLAAGYYFLSTP
jgi:hypothetical protein